MSKTCSQCGREYRQIGGHWSKNDDCDYPDFTQRQIEILTGVLMGDGWVDSQSGGRKPIMRCKMITPDYLFYLNKEFGNMSNGFSLLLTGEESAKQARDSGFQPNANASDYSDIYEWRTISHPKIKQFSVWYSSGEKIFPSDLKLTPTTLKNWYVCDGNWDNSGTCNRIQIGISNESERTETITKIFRKSNLPEPRYNKWTKNGNTHCKIEFTVEDSKTIWQYMGEPLPGFDYKWPKQYR